MWKAIYSANEEIFAGTYTHNQIYVSNLHHNHIVQRQYSKQKWLAHQCGIELPALRLLAYLLSTNELKLFALINKIRWTISPLSLSSINSMPWWRHQMVTFSALLAVCAAGNSAATGEFPSQRPVTRSYDVFFTGLNKRLSNQSRGW